MKKFFSGQLLSTAAKINICHILMMYEDFNRHIEKVANGYGGVYGEHGYGSRNSEGDFILEFVVKTFPCKNKKSRTSN